MEEGGYDKMKRGEIWEKKSMHRWMDYLILLQYMGGYNAPGYYVTRLTGVAIWFVLIIRYLYAGGTCTGNSTLRSMTRMREIGRYQ